MQNLSALRGLRSFLPRRRTAALVGLALLVAGSSFAFLAPIDIKALHGWGALGGDSGQFRAPTGIATRSGIVYVLDSYNNRVQEFDSNGNSLRVLPAAPGYTFRETTGIAVDQADGTVYIASNYNQNPRVFKYSSSGVYLDTWGYYGHLDGQFGHVTGIAVGPDSNVYTVDSIRSNVQVFAPDHTFLRSWRVGAQPAAIAVSQDGFVYVAEAGTHLVSKFNLQGVFQFSWPVSTPHPKKIAVSPDGFIVLVTGENAFGIELYNSYGVSHLLMSVTTLHNGTHKLVPRGLAFYSSLGVVVIENRNGTIPNVVKFSVP